MSPKYLHIFVHIINIVHIVEYNLTTCLCMCTQCVLLEIVVKCPLDINMWLIADNSLFNRCRCMCRSIKQNINCYFQLANVLMAVPNGLNLISVD